MSIVLLNLLDYSVEIWFKRVKLVLEHNLSLFFFKYIQKIRRNIAPKILFKMKVNNMIAIRFFSSLWGLGLQEEHDKKRR